jgi:hypothetical protein
MQAELAAERLRSTRAAEAALEAAATRDACVERLQAQVARLERQLAAQRGEADRAKQVSGAGGKSGSEERERAAGGSIG